MIRAFFFACGLALGVLVYDVMLERQVPQRMPSGTMPAPYTMPCAATIDGKCYIPSKDLK